MSAWCLVARRLPRAPNARMAIHRKPVAAPSFPAANCAKCRITSAFPTTTPPYKPVQLPVFKGEPFLCDYNLCIDCRCCLVACNDIRGVGCLEIKMQTPQGVRRYVGTIAETLIDRLQVLPSLRHRMPDRCLMDRNNRPRTTEETMVPARPPALPVSMCRATCNWPQKASTARLQRGARKLPFPGIVGVLCFAMCESARRRGQPDDPLSIRSLAARRR